MKSMSAKVETWDVYEETPDNYSEEDEEIDAKYYSSDSSEDVPLSKLKSPKKKKAAAKSPAKKKAASSAKKAPAKKTTKAKTKTDTKAKKKKRSLMMMKIRTLALQRL